MPVPQGYCVVCKGKRELRDAKQIERGGGPAIQGNCAVCGSTIFVLGTEAPAADDGAAI